MKHLITAVALSVFAIGSVVAHTGATGIVKERMESMSDMGDNAKIVSDMFKGKQEFDIAAVVLTANSFVEHGSRITELFPDTEDSRTGKTTRALPKIWKDWDDFQNLTAEFEADSETLLRLSQSEESMDVLKKAFTKTAKGCSGCHKRFRAPKK